VDVGKTDRGGPGRGGVVFGNISERRPLQVMAADCRIRLLDQATVNKIAAGEVVERPASVVKELVENALDAGAAVITILVGGGGWEAVEVIDDGCGMTPEEARLALRRHATSKLDSFEGLDTLRTLGFRGEALPSIAAVSRLKLYTRPPDTVAGFELEAAGGSVTSAGTAGGPQGTRVTVSDLFYNTPARRKHLRAAGTEFAHICSTVYGHMFARPEAAFRLYRDGRPVHITPGSGRLDAAITAVYGAALFRDLLPVEADIDGAGLRGYVGAPHLARATRAYQYWSIGGRPVRSALLGEALETAYASLLPTGRHPVAFLDLSVDPAAVDVNVHPQKLEVRFTDDHVVRHLVAEAVRQALRRDTPLPERRSGGPAGRRAGGEHGGGTATHRRPHAVVAPPAAERQGADYPVDGESSSAAQTVAEPQRLLSPDPVRSGRIENLGNLIPMGQLHKTYIVAAADEGLYLIDQHAAHERVLYDRMVAARGRTTVAQGLLLPLVVQVTPAQMEFWRRNKDTFSSRGFDIREFGRGELLVAAVPGVLGVRRGAQESTVRDLLDEIMSRAGALTGAAGGGAAGDLDHLLLAQLACHGAIKAGDVLDRAGMVGLLRELSQTAKPLTCPHGRPTTLFWGRREIEREFRRT